MEVDEDQDQDQDLANSSLRIPSLASTIFAFSCSSVLTFQNFKVRFSLKNNIQKSKSSKKNFKNFRFDDFDPNERKKHVK